MEEFKICKSFFNFFFYGKPQVGFNRNQFWILWTCRINTVNFVFVLLKKNPKHRLAGVCTKQSNVIFRWLLEVIVSASYASWHISSEQIGQLSPPLRKVMPVGLRCPHRASAVAPAWPKSYASLSPAPMAYHQHRRRPRPRAITFWTSYASCMPVRFYLAWRHRVGRPRSTATLPEASTGPSPPLGGGSPPLHRHPPLGWARNEPL